MTFDKFAQVLLQVVVVYGTSVVRVACAPS
jgi:hypothetical protein